ncbi:hypothetical protein KIL84_018075 [Mauremys mutica]|uniref:Uncharacterized protein n=1 Tax=Mauremys mutica TaxID=74926 RepID=A0A9D4B936_9SAUR|nr:hypothetical protein KIL84_018075 [Mauremys mutica]
MADPCVSPANMQVGGQKVLWASKGQLLFSSPPLNSIIVDTVNLRGYQHQFKSTPYDEDWKCLDLFGRKAYSSATLQFHVANYQALLAKYNYQNYTKLSSFIEELLNSHKYQFKTIVNEEQLVAKMSLQSMLDVADTAECSISMAIIMRWYLWLHLSSFPKDVQTTVEDPPFEGTRLFAK